MTDEAKSPLRRRVIEDMTIRKLAPKTQHDYVQMIKNFAAFLGRSPDTADFESPLGFEEAVSAESVSQLRTSAYAIAKSEGQSPGIRATTDMLERYPISFPNVTSWSLV